LDGVRVYQQRAVVAHVTVVADATVRDEVARAVVAALVGTADLIARVARVPRLARARVRGRVADAPGAAAVLNAVADRVVRVETGQVEVTVGEEVNEHLKQREILITFGYATFSNVHLYLQI